jgi:hypothetical protein
MAISITKPTVGGSQDTWGETLNTALDTIVDGVNGTSGTVAPDLSALKINGTTVTATPTELNIMDGDTSATSTTVTGTDAIVFNDNGVMKQVTLNDINTFIQAQAGSAGNGQITVTGGGALNGSGSFTVNQTGNTTVTLNHDTSSQGSSNNSGNTFIQDITLDSYGHITGLGTATVGSVAGGGVPKNVYSTASNAALDINSVLNGDTLLMWHSTSSYIVVWDQAGWVGFNPSSTVLANFGSTRMAMWTNATGSTKNVRIQWNSGSTSNVFALHYG